MKTRPEVRAVVDVLARHGVRFVVVGGQAVVRHFLRTTEDVDVMVATGDFARTVQMLRRDPGVTFRSSSDGVAQFYVLSPERMGLDVLDAGYFSGNKPGEALFGYLVEKESTEADGIRYASVGFVWYTRLSVRRWQTYAEKIVADVGAGAGAIHLDRVRAIARQFGRDEVLGPRTRYLLEELKRTDFGDPSRA